MSDPSASGTIPAGQGGRRSPAGPTRGPARVGRVAGGAEDRVEGVRPGRELRHVRPAEHDDARAADPLDRQRRRRPARSRHAAASRRSCASPPPRGCPSPRTGDRAGGPPGRRRPGDSSAAAAEARARSASRETTALTSPLRSSIRARCRSSSSRAEIWRSWIARAISRAVRLDGEVGAGHLPVTCVVFQDGAGGHAEQHQSGTHGDPLQEVRADRRPDAAAGAVKTCPSPVVPAGDPRLGAALGPGQDAVDVAEELAGHPAGHAGEHPLADPTDHAADDGVGVVGDRRAAVATVAEARPSRRRRSCRGHRPPGASSPATGAARGRRGRRTPSRCLGWRRRRP